LSYPAAIGLGGPSVHKEVYLLTSNLLRMVLEQVDARCFHCFLTETIPPINASLREYKYKYKYNADLYSTVSRKRIGGAWQQCLDRLCGSVCRGKELRL